MKRTLQQAVGLVTLVGLVGVVGSCSDSLVSPEAGQEESGSPEASADPRVNLEVTEIGDEGPADRPVNVRVRGVFRSGDEEVTVTGYTVVLRYDGEALTPAASREPDGDGLRVVNLEAGPGAVKAAGAAGAGFEHPVLFDLLLQVEEPGYREGLSVELQELDVKEEGFADISDRVEVDAAASDAGAGDPGDDGPQAPGPGSTGPGAGS